MRHYESTNSSLFDPKETEEITHPRYEIDDNEHNGIGKGRLKALKIMLELVDKEISKLETAEQEHGLSLSQNAELRKWRTYKKSFQNFLKELENPSRT